MYIFWSDARAAPPLKQDWKFDALSLVAKIDLLLYDQSLKLKILNTPLRHCRETTISYFVIPLYFTPRFPKVRPPLKVEETCMMRSLKISNNFFPVLGCFGLGRLYLQAVSAGCICRKYEQCLKWGQCLVQQIITKHINHWKLVRKSSAGKCRRATVQGFNAPKHLFILSNRFGHWYSDVWFNSMLSLYIA